MAMKLAALRYGDKDIEAVNEKRTFAYIFGNEEYGYGAKITSNYGSGTEDRYIPVNLQEVVVSPSADYQIPAYGFAGVKLVETITLGDKVIAIGENAFNGCRDLTSVYLSATVKTIYQNAFEGPTAYDQRRRQTEPRFHLCGQCHRGKSAGLPRAVRGGGRGLQHRCRRPRVSD